MGVALHQHVPSSAPKGQSQKPTTKPDRVNFDDQPPGRSAPRRPRPTRRCNLGSEQDEAHRDGHATKFTPRPNRTKPAQTTTTNPDGVNFDSQRDEAHHKANRTESTLTTNGRSQLQHPTGQSQSVTQRDAGIALRRSSESKRKEEKRSTYEQRDENFVPWFC